MSSSIYSVITGTGSYIPSQRVKNEAFLTHEFYDTNGKKLDKPNQEIIDKFFEITTIAERRYVTDDLVTSDIAYYAALAALESANIDKEDLDYILVAHNFGDIRHGSNRSDMMPSLAARVKHKLAIENPASIAYDLPFGCPGWLQGVLQADYYIKSGDAKKVLVIGAEVLSRVCDPHDRDSMLYADGAGATIFEARESANPTGILGHGARSDTLEHARMLFMGKSYNPELAGQDDIFIKMHGRKLYQYALERVPQAIKTCLDECNIPISEVNKVLIHQANAKMDDEILKRLYKLYGLEELPKDIMPMTIDWLGNSSVASIPTILDLIMKDQLPPHQINRGDLLVFASVGAGMNINAFIYRV